MTLPIPHALTPPFHKWVFFFFTLSLLDFLEGGLVAGICQRSAIKSLFVVVLVDR